jgi:PAS domain S-box-containing protein
MGKKPTYERLVQRIADLEQNSIKRDEQGQEVYERYFALFDRSLFSVFVHDLDGNFLDANDAALAFLGYTKEEITSLNIISIMDKSHLSLATEVLEEILRTGSQKRPTEYKLRRKDGSFVWVETEGSIISRQGKPFAIQGIARDITTRKLTEEALRESERRYKTLVDHARDVIYTVSTDTTITSLNPAFEKATGWSRTEWIGKSIREIVHPDDWQSAHEMTMRLFSGETPPILEVRLKTKSSGFLTAEINFTEQIENNCVVGVIGIGQESFVGETVKQPFHSVAVLVGCVAVELETRNDAQAHPAAELAPHEWRRCHKAVTRLAFLL